MGTVHCFFPPIFQIWVWNVTFDWVFSLDGFRFDSFLFWVFGFSVKTFFSQIYKHAKTLYCFLFSETSHCWVSPVETSRILLWPLLKNRRLYSLFMVLSSQIIISGSYKNKIVGFCHCFFLQFGVDYKKS